MVEAPIDEEEEYIDEERYTTVTVEAVNVDRDGMHKPSARADEQKAEKAARDKKEQEEQAEKAEEGSEKRTKEWPKKKKKKFRYESKDDRRATVRKERAKNAAKR